MVAPSPISTAVPGSNHTGSITIVSELSSFAESIEVSSCAPMNATAITASPITKAGVKSRMAIPAASGNPVLTRTDKSEMDEASLILNSARCFENGSNFGLGNQMRNTCSFSHGT